MGLVLWPQFCKVRPAEGLTMGMIKFSFSEYIEILNTFSGRFVSFEDASDDAFTILRHDVEFSIDRALNMANLDYNHGVQSTFFFQILSNAYNPFSTENVAKINQIKNLGHNVGLHLYISHLTEHNRENLQNELRRQKLLFEQGLGLECTTFSFHRPPRWALEVRDDKIDGVINAYGPSFFEYSSAPKHIKYVADSQHKWAYGHPLDFKNQKKLQILLHPDEWSKMGDVGLEEFFIALINENKATFIRTLDSETKHFSEFKKIVE